MDIRQWAKSHGGVVHREDVGRAGFHPEQLAQLVSLNRAWFATPDATPALRKAAALGGRLTCVTAAQHLDLSLLRRPRELHLWLPHHGKRPVNEPVNEGVRSHWRRPLTPVPRHQLVQALPDVLQHVADCLPFEEALVVWEAAVRAGLVSLPQLTRIPWRGAGARRLIAMTGGKSDSLLETLVASRLRDAGIAFVQQARLLGHRVDFLIEGRLVLQIDGFAFHSDDRQREEDLRHDARLLIEGKPVMRMTYGDVTEQWSASLGRVQALLAQRRGHRAW